MRFCFLAPAFVQILVLILLGLAPHPPLDSLLAPPIRFFANENVLHYPWHLLWLYHVTPRVHALAMALVGAGLSGVAACLAADAVRQKPMSLRLLFASRRVRFSQCLFAWVVIWLLSELMAQGLRTLSLPGMLTLGSYLAGVTLLQAFGVYAIPAVALSGFSAFRALLAGAQRCLRSPLETLCIVLPPLVILFLFSLISTENRIGAWLLRTEPEWVTVPIALRLMLWTVADAWLTTAAAIAWIKPSVSP